MSKFQRSRPRWLRDPEREYQQAQDGGKWQGIPQKCSGSLLPKVGGWRGQPFSSSLEKGFQRQHLEGREHLAGLIGASRVWGLVRDICLRSQVWEGGWSGLRWQSRRPDRTKRLLAPSPRGGGGAVKGMWTLGIRNASLGLFKTGSTQEGLSLRVRGPQREDLNGSQKLLEDVSSWQRDRHCQSPGRSQVESPMGSPQESHRGSQERKGSLYPLARLREPSARWDCSSQVRSFLSLLLTWGGLKWWVGSWRRGASLARPRRIFC